MRKSVRPAIGKQDSRRLFHKHEPRPYQVQAPGFAGNHSMSPLDANLMEGFPFKRKDNSSGFSSCCRRHRLTRCRLVLPWSAAGLLNPLNFQPTRCARRTQAITPFHKCGPTLALVPSDPCSIAVDTEPFPTSAFNDMSRKFRS